MPQVADLLGPGEDDEPADVYCHRVIYREGSNEIEKFDAWARGTKSEAVEFCRRPIVAKPGYIRIDKETDSFVGVDNWGWDTGTIVAATPDLKDWIGKTLKELKIAAHA